jgi:hypothetical protein
MDESNITRQLAIDDLVLKDRWDSLVSEISTRFGRKPDIDSLLFLIGVQSVGRGYEPDIPKERKQSLIMEGSYLAFETIGVYQRVGMERNGFWIWQKNFDLPELTVDEQEKLLQVGILNYFEQVPLDNS